MRIKITAGGIYDGEGRELQVGEEFEVAEEPKGWLGRYETIGQTTTTDDKKTFVASSSYEAVEGKQGWYNIKDAEGNVLGKGIRKDEAEAFNAKTLDEQVAFVTEHVQD